MENKEFFDNLDDNIKRAKTKRTLKNLERIANNYIKHLPTSEKMDARKRFLKSRKLMREVSKEIK